MMPYDEQTNGAPYMTTESPSPPQMASDAKVSDNECTGDEANKHSSSNSDDVSDQYILCQMGSLLNLLFGSFFACPLDVNKLAERKYERR